MLLSCVRINDDDDDDDYFSCQRGTSRPRPKGSKLHLCTPVPLSGKLRVIAGHGSPWYLYSPRLWICCVFYPQQIKPRSSIPKGAIGFSRGGVGYVAQLIAVLCKQLMKFVELSCFALLMTTPLIYLAFGFVDVQPTVIGLVIISSYIMRPFKVVSTLLHLQQELVGLRFHDSLHTKWVIFDTLFPANLLPGTEKVFTRGFDRSNKCPE